MPLSARSWLVKAVTCMGTSWMLASRFSAVTTISPMVVA